MPAQPEPTDRAEVQKLASAVEEALVEGMKTFHRDPSPVPLIGAAPPVAQPGRPPMSQSAVDASTMMLSGGVATVLVGGAASLVMIASGYADPTVCAIVFGSPAALILALSRLARRAKEVVEVAPPQHHHYYNGDVYQTQSHTTNNTRGVWAKTINNP